VVLTASGWASSTEPKTKAMVKILLLGKNGQVGWELQRSLAPLGEVLALDRHSTHYCGDLSKLGQLAQTVLSYKPDFIVNAAAHTAVDEAESEPELARVLNTEAPAALAKAAAQVGAWLIHYSTDYVFDGTGTHARQEGEGTGPLSVYGQTKLDGEKAIAASGCKYLIFRTSWVYAERGSNFAKTMLQLAQERDKLAVINDQHGAPTGADLIADVTAHAMRRVLNTKNIPFNGVYHLVASGETTWYAYANHVIQTGKALRPDLPWRLTDIVPVATSAFPTLAKRPHNSRLCNHKLQSTFGMVLPHWQQGVDRMLAEILEVKKI
jgi:dTDP-4-dehydrorhamnose reductase